MISFRLIASSGLAFAMAVCSTFANAQLEQKLEAQYTLTKTTADRSDIVTAGSVLVLLKDDLMMDTATSTAPMANTYKNGKITHGMGDFLTCKWCKKFPGASSSPNVDTRTFVAGEKFWVTKIEMHDDGVMFYLFSDPISDVRYYSTLKFPFTKGSAPDTDKMVSTVAEVLKVDDSGGDSKQQASAPASQSAAPAGQQAAAPAPATSPSAMAPIAPPPPPADAPPPQPKTVAIGQTKDQVVAIFGQPSKIANLGSKEIDYYPDFKVTFVGGKVTNIQ